MYKWHQLHQFYRRKKENDALRDILRKIYRINEREIGEYGKCDHSGEIKDLCLSVRFLNN